ncbi:glycosyltransferase family 2 protein [Phormidium tenue FACHB-886]|nr:glycosyltransferase family 2 protein [Phormidium tenue FACHB-886]
MKKVTVIIPVYGVERYIAATVQSVLAQTYENFELLIVDDGSPDRSIEICRQFTDPRIRILQQPNGGPAAARNLGIREATGEYIALLDGDDLWLPKKLETHVAHLESSPQAGVSFCRSALIDEEGESLGIYQVITKLNDVTPLDLLCRTPIGNGSVPVIRREVLDAIQYVDDTTGEICYFNPDRQLHPSEDVECWMRIALKTDWQITGIPDALTLYRVNSRGFSANLWKKLQSWEKMLLEVRSYGTEQDYQRHNAPAMSYQFRHLARRAVTLRDGTIAVQLIHRSLLTYPRILTEESMRTLQTLAAAYLVRLLPRKFYQQFETAAMQFMGTKQRQYMSKRTV